MKVCIFGAASNNISRDYIESVEKLGCMLAEAGHELVFGAGGNGLMGAAARGFTKGGGRITGVIPGFFRDEEIELIYDKCDELIFTETMHERKMRMEELADVFIIAPGGIGTFEEFYEVLTLKQLRRHDKPIALYNIEGYFNNLMSFMKNCTDEGFITKNCADLYICTPDCSELIDYIENSKTSQYTISDLKNG